MFAWFDARAAKAFGESLAAYVLDNDPLTRKNPRKRSDDRARFMVKNMKEQMATFRSTEKLNIYKIAQMTNAFKWKLKEAGYDDSYIDELTTILLTHAK